MSDSTNSKRIAKNTLALYMQMFVSMLIGLYISRVVLNVLGVEDFGIYNVVGGVVAMFGVLNSAMASSTSRFITFELGNDNKEKLKTVFSTALFIHIIIGLIVCIIAEPLGVWFMKSKMNIPSERLDAALWVFHFAVISTFISILNVPYSAVIIAHEKMSVFAYISVIDVVLRLSAVLLLSFLRYDKLIFYAAFLFIVQLILQLIYLYYCHKNFHEVRGKIKWDKLMLKKMSSFAGWSLFGDSAVMMMTQGVNILLNIFFGAAINAGRGIAVQVQGVVSRFIGNFQTALNPQLTKSYAKNDLVYMHKLIFASSKYSFFLFLILALPIYLDAPNILKWWLKIVPDHTVNFVRILLVISLIDCLSNPLVISAKATGNIKRYQFVLGSLLLLIVPISYVALKLGYPPESVFVIHLFIVCLGQVLRVLLIRRMIALSIRKYVYEVLTKCFLILVLAPILPYLVFQQMSGSVFRFLVMAFISTVSTLTFIYVFGMNKNEKTVAFDSIRTKFLKS